MRYDASTRTFEIYSEDNALLGMRQIEVRGYFRDYPSIKSDLPNLTTTIEILDPCLKPASITDPGQISERTYNYSKQGLNFKLNDLVVDPNICPVTYECVSIGDADSSITCDSNTVFKLDSASGQISVMTSDMARYKPGDYPVVIRGSAGS